MNAPLPADTVRAPATHGWSAVFALSLCVATLIASEFMPVSLLTPIAGDLHLSEGTAGQAIAVSGIFAVLTSLFIARATAGIDRRRVLLALTIVMLVSGIVVALAPDFTVLMIGRAMIGVVIGGFWSMSGAIVMRLVPADSVPRALAVLNGGNALATTIAAPLGSFLGQYIGWRGAFFAVVPLAAITFAWQWWVLPAMPSPRNERKPSALGVLRRRHAPQGMLAVTLLFMGQFALFTYLRPFLETVTKVPISLLSLILALMGGAGLIGSALIGMVLTRHLRRALIVMPAALGVIAIALIAAGHAAPPTAALLILWGMIATAAPVGWWTWLSRTLPEDAEAGGGLMVAVIQLAITLGAAGSGVLFDHLGYAASFAAAAALLLLSAAVGALGAADIASPR
ncbi:MFS transporter [Sphingomonas sp. R1]|uniref:MFS transporter n=1 Tax=Sphingomonas sp. R1 TaxID=399176 RepID=UPI0022240ACC|nr:MFS transporter [Sphingomonas sp. R1]UYY78490.1 MFS transporter [Sphingomonas sp. R1]